MIGGLLLAIGIALYLAAHHLQMLALSAPSLAAGAAAARTGAAGGDRPDAARGAPAGTQPVGAEHARAPAHHPAAGPPADGARQSPRGDKAPPALTFGPLGKALRLNWLKPKNRCRKFSSHRRIVARSYSCFA